MNRRAMNRRTWLSKELEETLSRLRCNAWRFNAKTKAYDRVEDDVAEVENALREMTRVLFEIENGGRCLTPVKCEPCGTCPCCLARGSLVELGLKGGY